MSKVGEARNLNVLRDQWSCPTQGRKADRGKILVIMKCQLEESESHPVDDGEPFRVQRQYRHEKHFCKPVLPLGWTLLEASKKSRAGLESGT